MNQNTLNVLIVDDEINIRKTLSIFCETQGYSCKTASNVEDAMMLNTELLFDVAFVDLRLGTDNGLDLLPLLLKNNPSLKIIVITAYSTIETAVRALQLGAADYLPKPFRPDELSAMLQRIQTMQAMEHRILSLQEDIGRLQSETYLVSNSPVMQKVYELARQVAKSEATIMLEGPSGTGKTVLAKLIHQWSNRSNKPFGVISCPTLSPELLESTLFGHVRGAFTGAVRDNPGKVALCEGGTLFLDEVGELPSSIQAKLLRFIQEREYERVGDHITRKADVRIITATNTNLDTAVKEGKFREDLFFRLRVISITLPTLFDRKEDIHPLAESMLAYFGTQNHHSFSGFAPSVINAFQNYNWPGNLRELRNVIERMAILCYTPLVGAELLPENMIFHPDQIRIGDAVSLEAIEKSHIQKVIMRSTTLQEAAEILGIDQATLWRKRKQYGLD